MTCVALRVFSLSGSRAVQSTRLLLALLMLIGPTRANSEDIRNVYSEMLNRCVSVVQARSTDPVSDLVLYSNRKTFPQLDDPNLKLFQTMYLHPLNENAIGVVESETDHGELSWSCGFYTVGHDAHDQGVVSNWLETLVTDSVSTGLYAHLPLPEEKKIVFSIGNCRLAHAITIREYRKAGFYNVDVEELHCPHISRFLNVVRMGNRVELS